MTLPYIQNKFRLALTEGLTVMELEGKDREDFLDFLQDTVSGAGDPGDVHAATIVLQQYEEDQRQQAERAWSMRNTGA